MRTQFNKIFYYSVFSLIFLTLISVPLFYSFKEFILYNFKIVNYSIIKFEFIIFIFLIFIVIIYIKTIDSY